MKFVKKGRRCVDSGGMFHVKVEECEKTGASLDIGGAILACLHWRPTYHLSFLSPNGLERKKIRTELLSISIQQLQQNFIQKTTRNDMERRPCLKLTETSSTYPMHSLFIS